IIEESNFYSTVFIEVDEIASEIKDKYLSKILGDLSSEVFNKKWKLKFQQHIISVPQYLCDDLEPINEYEDNIRCISSDELNEGYDLETGFKRDFKETNNSYTF